MDYVKIEEKLEELNALLNINSGRSSLAELSIAPRTEEFIGGRLVTTALDIEISYVVILSSTKGVSDAT